MKITSEWLKEVGACREGKEWFEAQKETDSIKVLKKLLKENQTGGAGAPGIVIVTEYIQ